MSKKPKLLWIGDANSIIHVGQSVVGRECCQRLEQWYEIENLGFAHENVKDPIKLPYNIISCQRTDMMDVNKVSAYIDKSNPDVILFSHDCWMFNCLPQIKQKYPNIKFIGYLTFDGEPCYKNWYPFIQPYDKIVSPAEYGKKVLLDRWNSLNVSVCGYGIDHSTFRPPKQGKEQLKLDLTKAYAPTMGSWMNLHNKFLGIYVGANQDRKSLGLIHEAWKEFEKGKEDRVCLLMFIHSASLTEDIGSYDLSVFLDDTKSIRIINTPQPVDIIGQFMAASDVLFHPSAGGGFELTVAEAMAAGTVPIVIPFAGVTDYCNDSNSFPLPFVLHVGGYHVHRALSTSNNACEVLNQAYSNPAERQQKAEQGIKDVARFTWDNCAEGLHQVIEEVLGYDKNSIYCKRIV